MEAPANITTKAEIQRTVLAALEYATQGIRVNAVCPGFIETPTVMERALAAGSHPEVYQYLAELHPMKRLGKPEEIAAGVVWLCSEAASFGRRRTPEQVVTTDLRALARGRSVVIDGFFTTLATQLIRFFPRRFFAHMARLSIRPRQMPGVTQHSAHQ